MTLHLWEVTNRWLRQKTSLTYSIKPITMTLDTLETRRHLLRQAQLTVTIHVHKLNAILTAHYTGSGFVLLLAEGCSGQVCQSLLCLPKDGATEPQRAIEAHHCQRLHAKRAGWWQKGWTIMYSSGIAGHIMVMHHMLCRLI